MKSYIEPVRFFELAGFHSTLFPVENNFEHMFCISFSCYDTRLNVVSYTDRKQKTKTKDI